MSRATTHLDVRVAAGLGVLAAAWVSLEACSTDVRISDEAAGTSSSAGAGGGSVGSTGPASGAATSVASSGGGDAGQPCVPGNTQCTDCIDNDGDGGIDTWDTDCTGPLDDDESSFSLGIPGDFCDDPCKLDCAFDGNPGQGDDGCSGNVACYTTTPKCSPDAAPPCPAPTQECVDFCLHLTPNGCDCFGCCDVARADGSTATVLTSCTACTAEALDDPEACPPCQQVPGCYNPCEHCEYCLGKNVLPADCPADGDQGCSPDQENCSPTSPCPSDRYCLTGCCMLRR